MINLLPQNKASSTYELACEIIKRRKSSSSRALPLAKQPRGKRKCCSSSNSVATSVALIYTTIVLIIFILSLVTSQSKAALNQCDFERYHTGCFSQANFVCDPETNYCKCQPVTPILIDDRFCVTKSKANGICQYNQQCDNANGYFCSYLELNDNRNSLSLCPRAPNTRHQASSSGSTFEPHAKCRCLKWFEADGEGAAAAAAAATSAAERGGEVDAKQRQTGESWWPNSLGSVNNFASHNSWPNSHEQRDNDDNNKQTKITHSSNGHHNHHHQTGGSILPRLVWIFLLTILISLIALLFLIKFQSYRTERPFHQAEDRRSINSELDVPPPYEVAIRMKL